MEPASMIVTALVTALTAGVDDSGRGEILSDIKARYELLKQRLEEALANNDDGLLALGVLTDKPESKAWQAALAEEIGRSSAINDPVLVELTSDLLKATAVSGRYSTRGKYNINASHMSRTVIGDAANVTNSFGVDGGNITYGPSNEKE